jgi:hypothetical protein
MRRSWYFDYLEQMYPDLIEANREKVMAFLDDLHRWELDPGLYAADPKLSGRIEAGFTNLLLSFVQYQTAHNKVYVTQEIGEIYAASAANLSRNPAFNPSATLGPDGNWVTTVLRSYSLYPKGMVYGLSARGTGGQIERVEINTRGLADAVKRFGPEDVVRRKVVPVYLNMAMSRGLYAVTAGDLERAREEFGSALEIDPNFAPARQATSQLAVRK